MESRLEYYAYILSNKSKTLYTGVTNDLSRRLDQHRRGEGSAFTEKYNCHLLVWYQCFSNPRDAIAAEKKIKGWTRAKKVALIEEKNPDWLDLSNPSSHPKRVILSAAKDLAPIERDHARKTPDPSVAKAPSG